MSAGNEALTSSPNIPQESTNLATMPFDESESICSEDTRNVTHESNAGDLLPDG